MKGMNQKHVDVLVIGLGPAGIATAMVLNKYSLNVKAVDKIRTTAFKIGESLSPDAEKVLKELGFATGFLLEEHLPSFGNRSAWGQEGLSYTDFIRHPNAKGWHLNRIGFDQHLRDRAQSVGVACVTSSYVALLNKEGEHWWYQLRNGEQGSARFVVDASGRSNWLSRRLNADKVWEDQQMALVAWMKTTAEVQDSSSLIEATTDGWWYSAVLPGRHLVLAFFTDYKKGQSPQQCWELYFASSRYTKSRVDKGGFQLATTPAWADASSGYLPKMYGAGWAAVGDAALCYDPIAAHGITMALVSGRDAGHAIAASLKGNTTALHQYQETLKGAYAQYAFQRAQLYFQEKRWPDAPYWRNRRNASIAFLERQGVWE
jgi:flavin-dependent dehydrogenase